MMKVLIAGCGYVGGSLAAMLVRAGDEVTTLRRSPTPTPGAALVQADLASLTNLRTALGGLSFDAVVYSASPGGRSDDAYRSAYVDGLRNVLTTNQTSNVILVGSSGVQEQGDGAWVDETTPIVPEGFVARRLFEAEALVRRRGGSTLRLAGIYGPGRERLIDSVEEGRAKIPPGPLYTNRIHRDDAARMIAHLLRHERRHDLYFGCDLEAAPYADVLRFIASELNVAPPEPGEATRRSNKRIRSARIVRTGFRHLYPTYREGYGAIIQARRDRA
ncbi:MAG: nucleoside-diphosphate-sugar epimerase [Polyangiales bacterium]|jgi:nucleoside-diphosphate-sugar epimerase